MSSAWVVRKQRIYGRLAYLEDAVFEGGLHPRKDWELRERILQNLERLPRREADVWLAEHRQVREFIEAQPPPQAP
ncbi:hypothetical protein [Actinopolymorpha pittospori]